MVDSEFQNGTFALLPSRLGASRVKKNTPHPGGFQKSVKTQELEDTELGRIYGTL